MTQRPKQVDGNKEVMELLARAAAQAQEGLVRACALTMVEGIGAHTMMTGDTTASPQLNLGLDMIKATIVAHNLNVYDAHASERAPANRVEYDLWGYPICFDFTSWLVACEMLRVKEGAPVPLGVAFRNKPRSDSDGAKARFVNNVFRPMLRLFCAVEIEDDKPCRHVDFKAFRDVSALMKEGISVPRICIPTFAMEWNDRPVTITLRETDHHKGRNSNGHAWEQFGQWLRKQGERVIVVRDTSKAALLFGGPEGILNTSPEASRDLLKRAALYEQAKANFFVSNGPWSIAAFSSAPWVLFVTLEEIEQAQVNQPWYWRDYMGVDEYGQLPWSAPHQRIVYEPDKFENLKRAWEALSPAMQ